VDPAERDHPCPTAAVAGGFARCLTNQLQWRALVPGSQKMF
jgi:hypothetical protein